MSELEKNLTTHFGLSNTEQLKLVSNLFHKKILKKGDFFLYEGKPCTEIAFLSNGYIRIFVETAEREVTQWISVPGYFLTDLPAFMYGQKSRWNMQALEDVELFTISKSDYQKLNKLLPHWQDIEKHFIIHCFANLEDRILAHLSMTAEERYQLFFQHNKELFNKVPLQYLASMLGMTPETFSRIRKKRLKITS